MKRWLTLLAVALLAVPAGLVLAADDKDDDDNEVQVSLRDCPEAVQDAITKAAGDGTIKEIEKETEKGKVVYEAEVVIEGKLYEITVSEDGKLLGKELEDDEDDDDEDDAK